MSTEPKRSFVIASMFPQVLNTNGDAANARVLAMRAKWAGVANVELLEVGDAANLPQEIDLIVVGACGDPDRLIALEMLESVAPQLLALTGAGVPLLAVATGWELLSRSFETADGVTRAGLGLFAGRAVLASNRVSDDLVVNSEFENALVGYENHSSDYVLEGRDAIEAPADDSEAQASPRPLGRVLYGSGNGRSSSSEGIVQGNLIGTHLHGPVLAKNPALADQVLKTALTKRGIDYFADSPEAKEADGIALAARTQIRTRLGV
jgi:CobQ-like glutamine amidotransferase family enzyme